MYKMYKFYCPLKVHTFDDPSNEKYGLSDEPQAVAPRHYEDDIRYAIAGDDSLSKTNGLASQIPDRILADKINFVFPEVEMRGDTMLGVFNVGADKKLLPREIENLRGFLSDQACGGWGNLFEDEPIDTMDCQIYVKFWNDSDDYFMFTQDEFEARMNSQEQKMTLAELLKCRLYDVQLCHMDEDIESATIVELNENTLTEKGKADWSDVLNATVEEIAGGGIDTVIALSDVDPERISDFSLMLAGNCSARKYDEWVASEDSQTQNQDMNM